MSIKTLSSRIQFLGGNQINRINKQKLNSFKAALKNDYNARMIKTPLKAVYPVLINELDLKADYDKKVLSVEFDSQLQSGDVFTILDDHSHWMVYLPYLTETAYLRTEIIRCRYTLEINGQLYWIYFQGPTETDLRWFIKNNINVNELNLSGTIYIKNDENTKNYFKRFTKIKIDGHVWEVQVTDPISVPGILELEIQEYYDNSVEELPEIKKNPDVEVDPTFIAGMNVVKPNSTIGYSIDRKYLTKNSEWKILNNSRVKIIGTYEDNTICKVFVADGTVDPFTIQCGDYSLDVSVDWEKPFINGPQKVYPYETHKYWIDSDDVFEFSLNSELAKIIDSGKSFCIIEILSGKKGHFVLAGTNLKNEDVYSLDIEIGSL